MPKRWNTIGVVYVDRGSGINSRYYNYQELPLQARTLDDGKTYQYRGIYNSYFGRVGSLPVIAYPNKKLFLNDIVSIKLNSFLGQYATGKVRIYYPYY